MPSLKRLLIGYPEGERIDLVLFPVSAEGWRNAHLTVVNGPFSGTFACDLHKSDLDHFKTELSALYETLSGEAHLQSTEPYIDVTFSGDGYGGVGISGTLRPDTPLGCELVLRMSLDQTFLPSILADLQALDA